MEKNSRVQSGKAKKQNVGVADDSLIVLECVPKENLPANNNHINKIDKWRLQETHLRKGKRRSEGTKNEERIEHLELLNDNSSSLVKRTKLIVKTSDLSKEPKDDIIICSEKDRKREISDDLKEGIMNFKHMETRLDKIPKDILGKYGIVIEDSDPWKGLSVLEERINLRSEEEDEEGKLVIDEEEGLIPHNDGYELSEIKTDVGSSAKENTLGFRNCGHHLVISSVTSLQWSAACNLCDLVLPDAVALEIHKKGHCSFPGCLDFIPDESERGKHLQVHNANPSKPFRCDYCRKRFHYYRFTKKHRDVCKVLKRSKCPYCSYSSPKVGHFNKHMAKHVNKMICTDCKKSYIRVKKYAKHMYLHHRKEIWFQCPQCPIKFQQPERITKHIEIHKLNILQSGIAEFIQIQPIVEE